LIPTHKRGPELSFKGKFYEFHKIKPTHIISVAKLRTSVHGTINWRRVALETAGTIKNNPLLPYKYFIKISKMQIARKNYSLVF
jgi:hypothetical protein